MEQNSRGAAVDPNQMAGKLSATLENFNLRNQLGAANTLQRFRTHYLAATGGSVRLLTLSLERLAD
jgi:hypothetical protein